MSAINNNVLNGAYRMMNLQRDQMLQHQKKISSGKQINSAADDAAGLAISKKLETQVRGIQQANKNVQDGISMLQVAEGGLENQHSILQRIRMLAIESANDTLTNDDRSLIQLEVNQLVSELDKISDYTEFNTKKLLNRDGSVNIELLTNNTGITGASYPTGSWLEEGIHEINVTSEKNVGDINSSGILGEGIKTGQLIMPAFPAQGVPANTTFDSTTINITRNANENYFIAGNEQGTANISMDDRFIINSNIIYNTFSWGGPPVNINTYLPVGSSTNVTLEFWN